MTPTHEWVYNMEGAVVYTVLVCSTMSSTLITIYTSKQFFLYFSFVFWANESYFEDFFYYQHLGIFVIYN